MESGVTLNTLSQTLNMNYWEMEKVQKCVDAYSQDLSFTVFFSRLWNAICHIVGKSDWDQAKETMAKYAPTLSAHFSFQHIQDQGAEAQIITEFMLRYLVTRETVVKGESQYLIEKTVWDAETLNQKSLEEMISRAVVGNGKTFPEFTKKTLITVLQKERTAFVQDIDAFENYLNTDWRIQAARGISRRLDALSSRMSFGSENQPKEPNLLEQAEGMVTTSKKILDERFSGVPNTQLLQTIDEKVLFDAWKSIREVRQKFNHNVAVLKTPVYGF